VNPTRVSEPIWVTRPVLPPLEKYTDLLKSIWTSGTLTNIGPLHQRLEAALAGRLQHPYASLWNNGTSALMGALKGLDLHDEVIVTPFTFPATVHAISLLGLTPVFADIDPVRLTLSPESVVERVTSLTSGIVGTHLYGINCDTAAIGAIAREHSLSVLYDGAHSMGRHVPVFNSSPDALGDVTMLSFHATKLFHTVEGGALVTDDAELDRRFRLIRNFGIASEDESEGTGLNGKMSELHAAMGLVQLELVDAEINARAVLAKRYGERLANLSGISVIAGLEDSRQYLVLRVGPESPVSRDDLHFALGAMNVRSRRYFYPLCSDLEPYASLPSSRSLPNARVAANECLVLPLFGGLTLDQVDYICDVIDWRLAETGAA
jgi:dTDP-4-amino-4,6-dideoxygalactose transaminase